MAQEGLLRLCVSKRDAQILPLLLLQRLVESGTRGVAIEDAAQMLHCAPARVGQRLVRLLEKAPRHHLQLGFKPGRVCLSGDTLIHNADPVLLKLRGVPRYKHNLRRRVAWKQVQKLPAPPKTFTPPEAAKALGLSRKQTERLLAVWLVAPYVGMFMLKEKPIFFARLF
jgi:hypothetical protein